jgi:transcriptional regulator with XRE-family HTH domain
MTDTTTGYAFRENLRRQREGEGWTQGELARRLRDTGATALGHQTTLARIESGQRAVRLDEAVTLAQVLNTTLDALLVTPEAMTALDSASQLAFEMDGAHGQISEAVATFLAVRAGVTQGRAEVVQHAATGAYEGTIGQHAEEMLAVIDKSLTLTVEGAVAQGTEQLEREIRGRDDA